MQTLDIEGWMDVLQPLTDDELRGAWAEYQRSGPRTAKGSLMKPDAGALYRIAMRERERQGTNGTPEEEKLAFYARWVRGPTAVPSTTISTTMRSNLLAARLVTEDQLKAKGI